jgi:hypothetical protein
MFQPHDYIYLNVQPQDVMKEANVKYPIEILDMFVDFEMKKRNFEPSQTTSVSLKCPTCLYEIYKEKNHI